MTIAVLRSVRAVRLVAIIETVSMPRCANRDHPATSVELQSEPSLKALVKEPATLVAGSE